MIRRLDPRMLTALASVGAFGLLFTLGGAILWDGRNARSIAIGATIAATNLFVLTQIVASMIAMPAEAADGDGDRRQGNAGVWGVLAAIKMTILFGVIWLLLTRGLVAPIALVFGYGSMPIGIAIGALVSDKTARAPEG